MLAGLRNIKTLPVKEGFSVALLAGFSLDPYWILSGGHCWDSPQTVRGCDSTAFCSDQKRLCHLQAFEMRKTSLRTPGSIRVPLCVGLGPAETLAGTELTVRQVQL